MEGVRHAIGRDVGEGGGDVRDDLEVVVELEQALEEVLVEHDVGLSVDLGRVEGADVTVDREP